MNQTVVLCGTSSIADHEFHQFIANARVRFSNVTPEAVVNDSDAQVTSGCIIISESVAALEVTRILERLRQIESCLMPVVVADNPTIAFVVSVMRLGALNVVPVSESTESFVKSVEEALRISSERLSDVTRHRNIVSRIDKLSARQKEVMAYVVDGASNKTIAAELHLSPKTIEVHRASVMRKMQAKSLPDLVKFSLTQFNKTHSAMAIDSPLPTELPTTDVFSE